MINRLLCLLALLLLGLSLTACGGSALSDAGPQTGNSLSLQQWASLDHGAPPALPHSGLPAVPLDNGSAPRHAATAGEHTVLGADYLDQDRCSVDGTGLQVNDADNPDNTALGWALYQVDGLAGLQATSLNVNCLPGGLGEHYYVGVADYSTMSWNWFGPVGIPEFQLDLSEDNSRYVSAMGNLYFLLLCHGPDDAFHTQTTVITAEADPGENLPGAPTELLASKGDFADGVGLSWQAGAGASHYELERREVSADPNNGGGDWQPIGESDATTYFDPDLPAGQVYEYRARSVNDLGSSTYSNVDYGFAFGQDPNAGGEFGVQGYVYQLGPGGIQGGEVEPVTDRPLFFTITALDGSGTVWLWMPANAGATGFYNHPYLSDGQHIITPHAQGLSFDPPQAVFTVQNSPKISAWIDFMATPVEDSGSGLGIHGSVYGFGALADPDGPGVPAEGSVIQVLDGTTRVVISEVAADADGNYSFTALAAGDYILKPEVALPWFFRGVQEYPFTVGATVPDQRYDFWGQPNL